MEAKKRQRICTTTTTRPITRVPRESLPEEVLLLVISHWNVATLVDKKMVSRNWKQLCTDTIDAKRSDATKQVFTTNTELRAAVATYCGYYSDEDSYSDLSTPDDAEKLAKTYGWPINKWDVSNLQDF
jgi:hypothetical protein